MSRWSEAAESLVRGDGELAAIVALGQTTGTREFLRAIVKGRYAGRIALVTSFGAESAILLHLVAGIDRRTPVVFLETYRRVGAAPFKERLYVAT